MVKSAFVLASLAAFSQAVKVQEGYVIDLCPTEAQVSPITMPSSDQLLGLAREEGFAVAPSAARADIALLNRLEQLGEVRREFDTQNLIREGLAAAAREELINRYE